ncbi:MAG TPA: von Willebrand factor type A domain-containing protein, partial [Thermoanaerobaculia bacterium]|nr:von Willebrand factor type A domain-containing protein [Thermoanaerobaculia bacterium]
LAATAHGAVVEGRVADDGGIPLPGVTVTLVVPGKPLTTVTDSDGRFMFGGVKHGTYTIRATLAGFNSTGSSVRVNAERVGPLLLTLRVAAVSETITVTADAPIDIAPRRRIREHAFVDTKKQHRTTFAIDVDRASYASIRADLHAGRLPDADMVRIEEMVNYFTYSYPQPEGAAPFSVTTEVAGCPWNPKHRLLRVGIQGRNLEQWKMAPNNLVFLIDVSGSMADTLPVLQDAFRVLVRELRAEDRVAIVVYAGAAGLVLPSTSGADKQTILAAIDALEAGGSTAGGEGIELAYAVAQENFLEDGNNRVILATDGDFNVGPSSAEELERLIETKRRGGVFLSVVGVGGDDERMETLADKGNGNYAMIDSPREAEKVFRTELTGTLVTIAKDVKVQLEFDRALIRSYRQIGYENRALENEDFENDEKDAGELGAGHSVTALFELVPVADDARGRIGALRLRWKEPRGFRSKGPLVTEVIDEGKGAYEASPDMQFAAAVAELGMLLRDSPHKGTASWDDVVRLAALSRDADLDGTRKEFVELVAIAKGLDE